MTTPLSYELLSSLITKNQGSPASLILSLMSRYQFSIGDALSLRYEDIDLEGHKLRHKRKWIKLDSETFEEFELRVAAVEEVFPLDVKKSGGYMKIHGDPEPIKDLGRSYLFFADQMSSLGKGLFTRDKQGVSDAKAMLESVGTEYDVDLSLREITEMHIRELLAKDEAVESISSFLKHDSVEMTKAMIDRMYPPEVSIEVDKEPEGGVSSQKSDDEGDLMAGLQNAWGASRDKNVF